MKSELDLKLRRALDERLDVRIPEDFADRVMAKIEQDQALPSSWDSFMVRLVELMGLRPIQVGFAGLAFFYSATSG